MDGNSLSDAQLAGQRLMVGFDGTRFNSDLADLVGRFKVGGVILFAQNVQGPGQVRTLCADLQACARDFGQPPLLVAIDQEGGQVARLKPPFTQFPGNPAMTSPADARRFAEITASELEGIGVNMNMAPVMDVACPGVDSVMAGRAFGADPAWVSRMGCAVIRHLQNNRIMAVAKHFPGIGRTTLDSHLDQPVLDTEARDLAETDLPPFAAAVGQGVSGIMLSHILYRGLDKRWPASLSVRIAGELLRERMGFNGVVMTDDLDMGSIKGRYGLDTIVDRIVRADIDMALICHKGPDIQGAFHRLLSAVRKSPETRRRAEACADRILALKRAYLSEHG